MRRAQSSTRSPSGVKPWKREPRFTSSTPICSSSCFTPGRQRRLGHAAGLGGAAEMPLAGQRQNEVELVDHRKVLCFQRVIQYASGGPRASRTAQSYARSIEFFYRSMSGTGLFASLDRFKSAGSENNNERPESRRRSAATAPGRRAAARSAPHAQGPADRPACAEAEIAGAARRPLAPARSADRASASDPGQIRPHLRGASRGARGRDEACRRPRSTRSRPSTRISTW